MSGDLGSATVLLCLLTGCGVRLWRWLTGQHSPRGKQASVAFQNVRVSVRRPAVDAPVESEADETRSKDVPLLP